MLDGKRYIYIYNNNYSMMSPLGEAIGWGKQEEKKSSSDKLDRTYIFGNFYFTKFSYNARID